MDDYTLHILMNYIFKNLLSNEEAVDRYNKSWPKH